MDWRKIEAITGHQIVFASLVGSRRFGLERVSSADSDYALFVRPQKGSSYDPNSAYVLHEAGEGDLFFHDVAELRSLAGCAGIYTIEMYGSVVYAPPDLGDFIAAQHQALANLSPFHTYMSCLGLLDTHLETGVPAFIARSVRDAGILYRFARTGDMETGFDIPAQFKVLYNELHAEDCKYTSLDVRAMLQFLYSDEFYRHFKGCAPNMALFDCFQEQLSNYF